MCGIAGSIWKDRSNEFRNLKKLLALNSMTEFYWIKKFDNLVLGHTRLAIIDLNKKANQPMLDDREDGLVYNGEIYNFMEIRKY